MLSNPIAAIESHAAAASILSPIVVRRSNELLSILRSGRIDRHRTLLRQLIKKVVVSESSLAIHVDWPALCSMLNIVPDAADDDEVVLGTAARLTRSGRVLRMIQEDGRLLRPTVDITLVRLIVKARNWWLRLQQERGLTVSAIAEQEGVGLSYVGRIVRFAFLSPSVVQAIISCRQPAWMDGGALSAPGAIALNWEDQKQQLLLGRAI